MAFAVALGIGVFHGQILTGLALFMTVRDPLDQADLILPLYHEGHTIPFAAAELYHQGYAKRVALLRTRPSRLEALGLIPSPHEVWRQVLEAQGVPREAIITIDSRIENSETGPEAVAPILGHARKIRIIGVASAPLSRLSRDDLRHRLAGFPIEISIYPVRPRDFDEQTWWHRRKGWITYFDVYYLWLLRSLRD